MIVAVRCFDGLLEVLEEISGREHGIQEIPCFIPTMKFSI